MTEELRSMSEVKLRRLELLDKVKANREIHKKNYEDAMVVYKEAAVAVLEEAIASAQKQITDFNSGEIDQIEGLSTYLPRPIHHLDTYDRVISMLEMSVDEFLLLPEDQFSKYRMDKWDWSADFNKITGAYGSSGSQGAQGFQGFQGVTGATSLNNLRKKLR